MSGVVTHPPLIKTLGDLHRHLQAAIELEHGTIPPYLCALYSIKPGRNSDAAEIIRTVVVQEMLHMVLVANVMNAVGGSPSIAFPAFVPSYPIGLPLGQSVPLQVHLRPFSSNALDTFLAIERPAPPPPALRYLALKVAAPIPPGQLAKMVRAGQLYASIGEFYAAIEHGLTALEADANANGGSIFVDRPDLQVGPEHFYGAGGVASPVSDLHTAKAALEIIVRQGEGYGAGTADGDVVGGEREIAHFYRFDQLRRGRRYLPTDKPGDPTGASVNADFGPDSVYPMIEDPTIERFPAGEVQDRAVGFAKGYTALLHLLQEGLNGKPARLIESGVMMFDLRRRAIDLMANPLDDEANSHAGPCFEFLT